MFDRLMRRARPEADIATRVYGAIVAHARKSPFYADLGVPDTVTGRFEMLVVHLALLLGRLHGEEAGRPLAQAVFDLFCVDMDRSLRELGFGDLGVPHRMKEMTEAFYGRARVYGESLAAGDRAALVAAVERNVFAGEAAAAPALADYMIASAAGLAAQPVAGLDASLAFADPSAFVAEAPLTR